MFPNLRYLELDFSVWKLRDCEFPRVLLEGIKDTGWKLEELVINGLDYRYDHHREVKEELEEALLKNALPF